MKNAGIIALVSLSACFAFTARLTAADTTDQWLIVNGDFTILTASTCDSGANLRVTVVVLKQDGTTALGTGDSVGICPDQVSFHFAAPRGEQPAFVRVIPATAKPITLPLKASPTQTVQTLRRQVITGDFCRKNVNCDCTTELLKPTMAGTCSAAGAPNFAAHSPVHAFVLDNSGIPVDAVVQSLAVDAAEISFSAPASYTPSSLHLSVAQHPYTFDYTPQPPVETIEMVFGAEDLRDICNTNQEDGKAVPDCEHTSASDITLADISPVNSGKSDFTAIQDGLLFTSWRGPMGQEPYAVIVRNGNTAHPSLRPSVVARRTLKPGQRQAQLNIDMSIMDQVTAQRNYGNRIAKRYLAVTLDVKNPGERKLQFNKSALYFDVDYEEARQNPSWAKDFVQQVGTVTTLGFYQPSPYQPPFVAKRPDDHKGLWTSAGKLPPRVARFGLEQNVKQSPLGYLTVLGSFDDTTEKTDSKLKYLELFGSVLSNIATGGLVSDKTGSFKAGTSVFSGTFMPGVRSLVLNTAHINRLRTNLVSQTLQEIVQVPAHGSTSTIVLLPRTGILSFTDAEVPVMIKRVIDVHPILEVVAEVPETPSEKGVCKPGYTKDQARSALGEPTGVTTSPDGSSTFTFAKGPVASADFDVKGTLSNCKPRSAGEQLNAATTLTEADQILTALGLTAAKKIELVDDSTVLTNIPGVQQSYHFDAKGDRTTDYTFAFSDIKAQASNKAKRSDFETFLENRASALSADRASKIKTEAEAITKNTKATTDQSFQYSSPDVKNGTITVTFTNAEPNSKPLSATSAVDHISFGGDMPNGTP